MKLPSAPLLIALVFSFVPNASAQTRPRTVTTPPRQVAKAQVKTQQPQSAPARTTQPARTSETDKKSPAQQPVIPRNPVVARDNFSSHLSPSKIHQRIEEAERALK